MVKKIIVKDLRHEAEPDPDVWVAIGQHRTGGRGHTYRAYAWKGAYAPQELADFIQKDAEGNYTFWSRLFVVEVRGRHLNIHVPKEDVGGWVGKGGQWAKGMSAALMNGGRCFIHGDMPTVALPDRNWLPPLLRQRIIGEQPLFVRGRGGSVGSTFGFAPGDAPLVAEYKERWEDLQQWLEEMCQKTGIRLGDGRHKLCRQILAGEAEKVAVEAAFNIVLAAKETGVDLLPYGPFPTKEGLWFQSWYRCKEKVAFAWDQYGKWVESQIWEGLVFVPKI